MLSLLVLRMNTTFLSTGEVMYNTKFEVLAVSLGTSMIEEANSKAFDHNTDTNSVSLVTALTLKSALGPEPGETFATFNDFDDFNNYEKTDTIKIVNSYEKTDTADAKANIWNVIFKTKCRVSYIDPVNPDAYLNDRSWHKKIDVEVTSPAMQDTVRLSSVFSYWFFR